MANTKSAAKRYRQADKKRAVNSAVRAAVRTAIKKAREALAKDPASAKAALLDAERALARAATRGVLHPRNAARRISRLAKSANRAPAAQ